MREWGGGKKRCEGAEMVDGEMTKCSGGRGVEGEVESRLKKD